MASAWPAFQPPNDEPEGRKVLEGQVLDPEPTPEAIPVRSPKRPLGSISQIKRELVAVYRDARAGKLDPSIASKLTFILSVMARMTAEGELEERLAEIERRAGIRR